jgi:FlaA1/EpsC-like NDP-sugar epimerase
MTAWLITDVLLFIGAFVLAYFMRVGWILSSDYPVSNHLLASVIAAPVFLSALLTTRTMALTRKQSGPRNTIYIAYAGMLGTAAFSLAYYFLYRDLFSRLLLVEAFVLSSTAVWLWHQVFGMILRSTLRRSPPVFRALIVGVTRESRQLIGVLARRSPIVPVAILDGRGVKETAIEGVPVKGKLNNLEEVLIRDRITHLIQCADVEQSLNLLGACRSHGITYLLLPSVLGMVERDERIETLEGQPVTMVSPREGWWMWFFR